MLESLLPALADGWICFFTGQHSGYHGYGAKTLPDSRSMVSSLSNGVSWGIANLFVTPVGIIADIAGLQATLNAVAFLPWLVTLLYIGKKIAQKIGLNFRKGGTTALRPFSHRMKTNIIKDNEGVNFQPRPAPSAAPR